MSFKQYISTTASLHGRPLHGAFTDTPEADFTADAANDSCFPDLIRDWDHLEGYLVCRGACWQAIEAARSVWSDYQQSLLH